MNASMRLGLCALLAAIAGEAAALTPEDLFEQRSPSIFVVHTFDKAGKRIASGSGVVIDRERVITNCHVLAKAARVRVSHGNASFGASLEFPDAERDLCQLRVRDLTAPAVPLANVAGVKIGQRVYAIGAPQGLELTLSDGLVSSLREIDEGKPPVIQTSTPVSPGSSGGGLFDANGNLIGITTFAFRGQQLNFAVPSDWVREVPERGKEALAKRKEAAEARAAAGKAGGSATVAALAPLDPSLPKEMPQPGDTWTYAVIDVLFKPGDRSRKYVHTVRNVNRGSIVEVVTLQGAEVSQSAFTADLGAVYRPRAEVLEVAPFATAFRRLQAGEQWGPLKIQGMESIAIASTNNEVPYAFENARVVGNERVTVPAGTFDSIRVELDGKISNVLLTGSSVMRGYTNFTQTVWYAPEVKRIVKLLAQGPSYSTAYELESYTLR